MAAWKIPLFDTDFGPAELEAVQRPVKDGWLTLGPRTTELEAFFADLVGARHAIALTNCTSALHLSMVAAGVGPGDEVIVPSLTFVASANAVRYCGGKVVFADIVGEHDLTLDPEDVRRRITARTKALVTVHYAGFPSAVGELQAIAAEHGLALVEDCAHALVTHHAGRVLGNFGDSGCFSFFSNKNVSIGEGGMTVTNDDRIAERIRLLRSHGMTAPTLDRHEGRASSYDCVETGWNFRIDEIRASLARVQLGRLPEFLERRANLRRWYLEELGGGPVILPFTRWDGSEGEGTRVGYHIMPVLLPPRIDRDAVMHRMKEEGIQTSVHYPPAHLFSAAAAEGHGPLPVTERVAARELTLPFYPGMSRADVRTVCASLRDGMTAA